MMIVVKVAMTLMMMMVVTMTTVMPMTSVITGVSRGCKGSVCTPWA